MQNLRWTCSDRHRFWDWMSNYV